MGILLNLSLITLIFAASALEATPLDEIFNESTGRGQRILGIPPGEEDYLSKVDQEERIALMVAARNFANIDIRSDAKQRMISTNEWEAIKKSAYVLKNATTPTHNDFLYYQNFLAKVQDISRGFQNIPDFAQWAAQNASEKSNSREPSSTSVLNYFSNYLRNSDSGTTPEQKLAHMNDTISYARLLHQQSTQLTDALKKNPQLWHSIPADFAKMLPSSPENNEDKRSQIFLTYLTLLESTLTKGLPTTTELSANLLRATRANRNESTYSNLSNDNKNELMKLAEALSKDNKMSQTEIKVNFEEFLNSKKSPSIRSLGSTSNNENIFQEFLNLMRQRPDNSIRLVFGDTPTQEAGHKPQAPQQTIPNP